jgi:hypothetical protein
MKFHRILTEILFCICLLLSISIVKAENSIYSLIIYSNSNVINPGDSFQIGVFISGKGKITDNHIEIEIPRQLVQGGTVIGYGPEVLCEDDCCFYNYEKENWVPLTSRNLLSLRKDVFKPSCSNKNQILSMYSFEDQETGHVTAPINIKFKISKNADPGDYILRFNFYYNDGNNWYYDKEALNIHVNTFYERNEMKLWYLGFIIAFVSMALSFRQITDWIWENFSVVIVVFLVIFLIFLIFVFLFALCDIPH